MARERGVDMPIASAVAAVLGEQMTVGRSDRVAAGAAARGGGMIMAYWLLKTEPETFSWDDQVKRAKKANPGPACAISARNNLKKMKKGDAPFFYQPGDEPQVVGIVEVIREHYPDPTARRGKFVVVNVRRSSLSASR